MHKFVYVLNSVTVNVKRIWRGLCIDDKVMVCTAVVGAMGLYLVATT